MVFKSDKTHAHNDSSVMTTPATRDGLDSKRITHPQNGAAERIDHLIKLLGLTPRLVRAAAVIFLCSRLALIAITGAALLYTHVPPTPGNMLRAWERWDATIYGTIAHYGYAPSAFYRAAFFPLEPLLAWIASPLTGGNTRLSAMLVSNLAFLGALLGIAALARFDQDDRAAVRAMLLLTFFPLAFFTFAGYSESVFLCCITWALVAIRREWWVAAYILGLGAGLARQVGILLMVPYAMAYFMRARGRLRNLDGSVWGLAGPPLGLALFCVWLWRIYGDPLAWLHAEALWRRSLAPPWVGFARTIMWALNGHSDIVLARRAFIEMGLALLFAALIVVGARRLPLGETVYNAVAWLVCVSFPDASYGLISLGRLLLPLIPCFLTLALVTRRRWAFVLVIVTFAALFAYLAQYFVRGYAIL